MATRWQQKPYPSTRLLTPGIWSSHYFLALLLFLLTHFSTEAQNMDPILHIDFESDWLGSGTITDASGMGNTIDCQAALNQCPSISVGADGSRAGHFSGFTYNPDKDSDYLAIQDAPRFKNMAAGTFTSWAKYSDGTSAGHFLDSWDYAPGTWRIGRYWRAKWPYEFHTTFIVAPERTTDSQDAYRITFPDEGVKEQWNHYAVTWDGKLFKGYYNGVYIGQSRQAVNPTTNRYYLAVGAFGHYVARNTPDPAHQTTFPNNGFLNGDLDDLRLYARALSSQEIFELFSRKSLANVCGNGKVEEGEECDDGNQAAGDGCAACHVEAGYSCSGTANTCLRYPDRIQGSLTTVASGSNQFRVVLVWRDNAVNEDGYSVERRFPGGTWQAIAGLPANTTSYEDIVNSNGTQYYYRVRAQKAGQYSEYSEVSRIFPTESPQQLELHRVNANRVALAWVNTSSIQRTSLEFSNDGDQFVTIQDNILGTSTEDSYNFQSGKTYYYRVCIFHDASKSCSAYSNTIAFTASSEGGAPSTPSSLSIQVNEP